MYHIPIIKIVLGENYLCYLEELTLVVEIDMKRRSLQGGEFRLVWKIFGRNISFDQMIGQDVRQEFVVVLQLFANCSRKLN